MFTLKLYLLISSFALALAAGPQLQTNTFDGAQGTFDIQIPDPFVKVGNKYYYFEVNKKANWWEALHHCRRLNANLVTVQNEKEIEGIYSFLQLKSYDPTNYYWTAAHDNANPGTFVSTATGEDLTYTKWSPGNPDNHNDIERCMLLWVQNSEISMNDFDCAAKCNYICETNVPKTIAFTFW